MKSERINSKRAHHPHHPPPPSLQLQEKSFRLYYSNKQSQTLRCRENIKIPGTAWLTIWMTIAHVVVPYWLLYLISSMATKNKQPDWYLPPEGEWEWRCDGDVERTTVHRHFLRGPSGATGSTTTTRTKCHGSPTLHETEGKRGWKERGGGLFYR